MTWDWENIKMVGLGIVALFLIILVAALIILTIKEISDRVVEWYPKWIAQRRGIPEADYQSLNTSTAWREPLEFASLRGCPHCGKIDVHSMSEPDRDTFNFSRNKRDEGKWQMVVLPPHMYETSKRRRPLGDHPACATVRRCGFCGHIWGEK